MVSHWFSKQCQNWCLVWYLEPHGCICHLSRIKQYTATRCRKPFSIRQQPGLETISALGAHGVSWLPASWWIRTTLCYNTPHQVSGHTSLSAPLASSGSFSLNLACTTPPIHQSTLKPTNLPSLAGATMCNLRQCLVFPKRHWLSQLLNQGAVLGSKPLTRHWSKP